MIITLVVVIIDASLKSRSPTVAPRLSAATWVDKVLPLIQESTTEGRQIEGLRTSGVGKSTAAQITSEMNQAATAAKHNYQSLAALRPPDDLVGAAGLLEACLLVRSEAASAMAQALTKSLANGAASGSNPQVGALATAGQDFQVADRAYQLFAQRLPSVGVKAPGSTWVTNPSQYLAANLQIFLSSLVNAQSGLPVHQITIASVTLNPGPLSTSGGVDVLTPTSTLSVSVVVANTGTEQESNLAVQVMISPSMGNAVFKQVISLPPGAAYNAQFNPPHNGPLNPKPGAVTTLTATVTPPTGDGASVATQTVTFMTTASPTSTPSTTGGTGGAGSTTTAPPPAPAPASG